MAKKALASKTGEVKYLQQGPVGPLVYPTGEYAASVSYTRTPLSAPMVLCEGQYYVLNTALASLAKFAIRISTNEYLTLSISTQVALLPLAA